MDSTTSSAAMQQISPILRMPDPDSDPSIAINYAAYYSSNPGFHHQYATSYPQVRPPGIEATAYVPTLPAGVNPAHGQAHQALTFDPNVASDASAGSYYGGLTAAATQCWIDAIRQLTVPYVSGLGTVNPPTQSKRSNSWIKHPKKAKLVQSAWCEVCNIDCNSRDVLDQHKLGKKHKKNLEKSKLTTLAIHAAGTPSASLLAPNFVSMEKAIIGPVVNPNKLEAAWELKTQKKKAGKIENLETKKRKVLEGGAAADAVRTCIICNVVCNSETVFNYHLAGQKHASMIRKLSSKT